MDQNSGICFREDSSLMNILRDGVRDDRELRMIVSSLVLKNPSDDIASNPKLNTIFRLCEMILKYEDFCDGGPMGIL